MVIPSSAARQRLLTRLNQPGTCLTSPGRYPGPVSAGTAAERSPAYSLSVAVPPPRERGWKVRDCLHEGRRRAGAALIQNPGRNLGLNRGMDEVLPPDELPAAVRPR